MTSMLAGRRVTALRWKLAVPGRMLGFRYSAHPGIGAAVQFQNCYLEKCKEGLVPPHKRMIVHGSILTLLVNDEEYARIAASECGVFLDRSL